MGGTALDLIEAKVEWVQQRVFYGTMEHLSDNLDSLPMPGMGFSFMRRSAASVLQDRMEERLLPKVEEHIDVQLAFVGALVETDDQDAAVEEYQDRLLETDPLWDVMEAATARAAVREDIITANVTSCSQAAAWVSEAGDQEFDGFRELMEALEKTPETVIEELNDILYYVELMNEYREHIDARKYSSVLSSDRVHDWFVETFLEGLALSEQEVLDAVEEELTE